MNRHPQPDLPPDNPLPLMKYLPLVLICLLPLRAGADGFPFDVKTQEVHGANIRLPLTETQQNEVAATGAVSLTNEQLGWLRPIYPKVPSTLRVIASTYNDGLDERPPNPVDCIWTAPAEIAITLRKKWEQGNYSFDEGGSRPDQADLRISPTGQIYHLAEEISLEQALTIIRTAKKPERAPASESPIIRITRPPPFREQDDEALAKNRTTAELFGQFVRCGKAANVLVQPIW